MGSHRSECTTDVVKPGFRERFIWEDKDSGQPADGVSTMVCRDR